MRNLLSSLLTIIRIRRIKCDEAKPECNRCIVSGWKCEGYNLLDPQVQQSRRRSQRTSSQSSSKTEVTFPSQIQPYSPIFNTSESEGGNELRSFKYFQSRVKDISGYFESDFWSRLVLQVSHIEPAVRHALLALSSVYEAQEYGENGREKADSESRNRNILQQYNKAVGFLSKKLAENDLPLQVTLVTCNLFI